MHNIAAKIILLHCFKAFFLIICILCSELYLLTQLTPIFWQAVSYGGSQSLQRRQLQQTPPIVQQHRLSDHTGAVYGNRREDGSLLPYRSPHTFAWRDNRSYSGAGHFGNENYIVPGTLSAASLHAVATNVARSKVGIGPSSSVLVRTTYYEGSPSFAHNVPRHAHRGLRYQCGAEADIPRSFRRNPGNYTRQESRQQQRSLNGFEQQQQTHLQLLQQQHQQVQTRQHSTHPSPAVKHEPRRILSQSSYWSQDTHLTVEPNVNVNGSSSTAIPVPLPLSNAPVPPDPIIPVRRSVSMHRPNNPEPQAPSSTSGNDALPSASVSRAPTSTSNTTSQGGTLVSGTSLVRRPSDYISASRATGIDSLVWDDTADDLMVGGGFIEFEKYF